MGLGQSLVGELKCLHLCPSPNTPPPSRQALVPVQLPLISTSILMLHPSVNWDSLVH